MKSNLIPITRIYDIYPKYTYSNDVKKFMDEIVDIDRADVYTKADMMDVFDMIRAEIVELRSKQNVGVLECLDIIDKYKAE